jgi:hypothetical protein
VLIPLTRKTMDSSSTAYAEDEEDCLLVVHPNYVL